MLRKRKYRTNAQQLTPFMLEICHLFRTVVAKLYSSDVHVNVNHPMWQADSMNTLHNGIIAMLRLGNLDLAYKKKKPLLCYYSLNNMTFLEVYHVNFPDNILIEVALVLFVCF